MFELRFEIAGDQQVMRGFSRFAEDVKDLSEPFTEILKDFREIEAKQFSSEGGYGSGGWKPLAASTIVDKQRQGYPLDILVRSGELRDVMSGGKSGYDEIKPLEMTIWMPWYGMYHQRGTPKMPARPVVQLTESDKTRWSKIIHTYLVKLARQEFADLMPTIGTGMSHLKSIQSEE
jgi:phage gpG-like protein